MADSTVPDGGFGIYSLVAFEGRHPVLSGEPVIQVPDITPTQKQGMDFMFREYAWAAVNTGGQNEGVTVNSIIPGLGMLANSHRQLFNVNPAYPQVEHGGMVRGQAGAGSVTHYQNFQWYAAKDISPGDEVFVNYGDAWDDKIRQDFTWKLSREIDWLLENGMCIDLIEPSPSPGRGKGAVASHTLPMGTVIAPVPVVAMNRTSFNLKYASQNNINEKQLLLNYAYGHPHSTVMLFPYSPVVNLVNHEHLHPNAVLRWSKRMKKQEEWFSKSAPEVIATHESGLLLELVAIRDIPIGEEVVISYGDDFEKAWQEHKQTFRDRMGRWDNYAYTNQVNKILKIKTLKEQEKEPYPSNVVTSCLHVYEHAIKKAERDVGADGTVTTRAIWESRPEVFHPTFLRPCKILERSTVQTEGRYQYAYTVELLNRSDEIAMQNTEENIPEGERHVVSGLPREAIHFADKRYSTDQHLQYAFRHEIGLAEGTFPEAWMDLSPE